MNVGMLCAKAEMSRQNFYKARKRRKRQAIDEQLVKTLVEAERRIQPRIGGFKLHHLLRPELEAAGVRMGRDRFFEVLKNQGLLLKRLPSAPRTTNSRHSLPVFTNLVKGLVPEAINEVWVSDITYIRTEEGFLYLSMITDMHSRKIVGYHLSLSLEARDSLKALEMALKQKSEDARPIHHSDRGCQYCSHEYVNRLRGAGMRISMTEENHCAENAMAERMNGILKQEYFLSHEFRTVSQARRAVDEAVHLYNTRRPHRALGCATPDQVHRAAA